MPVLTVCHLGPYPKRGGGVAAVTSMLVARQERDSELRVEALPTSVDGGSPGKVVAFAGSVLRLVMLCLRTPGLVLHVHAASGASFRRKARMLQVASWFGVPTLLHIHSGKLRVWYESASERRRTWIRRQLDRASHVAALSESWRTFLTSTPITVIPNAVDTAALDGEGREYALSGDARLLLLGGVGLRHKGAFDLLEALVRLSGTRLTIAGHGELAELSSVAAQRGLAARVQITGWVDQARKLQLLKEADLFVLPSYVEGLPVSLLEAMALGLPIVVTPVGGIPEVIEHERNGLLIQPGNVDGLLRSIRRLLDDQPLRERLGRAAVATVRERFDIETATGRLKALYGELAG